jgi:hypothetical protein
MAVRAQFAGCENRFGRPTIAGFDNGECGDELVLPHVY